MSGNVFNSPDGMRDYAQQIRTYIDDLEQLLQGLRSAHSNAGSNWQDAQYHRFEEELDTLISQINSVVPGFESYIQHLLAKADTLDSYLE